MSRTHGADDTALGGPRLGKPHSSFTRPARFAGSGGRSPGIYPRGSLFIGAQWPGRLAEPLAPGHVACGPLQPELVQLWPAACWMTPEVGPATSEVGAGTPLVTRGIRASRSGTRTQPR